MAELVTKYQQYAEYKNSGVEWLGEIPKDWQVVRLKYIAELSGNKTSGSANQYVGLENVESKTGKFKVTEGIVSEGVSNTFEKDNLLFGKLRPYLAKSWLASFSGICSSEFLVLDSKLIHPKFLKYMTLTDEFIEQVNSSTYGTKMPRASWDFIGLLQLPVMDYDLSKTIANFLDYETAQIDTLIDKQQTLIQLLKEKRQAVISHAVTKGLNPDAPMKDSGVEWLGEVPEHWNVAGFKKYLNSIIDYRGKTPEKVDSGKFLVTARNIKKGDINYGASQEYVSEKDYPQVMSRGIPEIGDVLFTTEAPLGEVAQVDKTDIALAQRIIKFSGQNGILDNTYLKFYIMSNAFQDSLMTFATGSTALGIKSDRLSYLKQLIPPLKEQLLITEHIERNLKAFDVLMMKAEQAIQLMQERRTALISAAVTGKIDVRGWQAPDNKAFVMHDQNYAS